ncbi:MAG: PH domain-containing protein [Phycisphaerae bacterium]|jgi:hypothetical protein|nr:PH domain-containing protein [Phycisphaerae bacterium]MCZ2398637.1 PH domain-containing protein [Phycisphaerae bacterium]NUQ48512.1 PH domain-containing protein [Phycisphaerae bacterium]
MSWRPLPDTLHSEAGVAEAGLATLDSVRSRSMEMLDGGELVELSLKPSLWYIPLVCGRYVAACGLLAVAVAAVSPPAQSVASALLVIACATVGLGLVSIAALQWASRLYVLTNRRVARFKGVMSVEFSERPLVSLERVELHTSTQQRWLGLGSIRMIGRDGASAVLSWDHLSRPDEVYRALNRAIQRARNGPAS